MKTQNSFDTEIAKIFKAFQINFIWIALIGVLIFSSFAFIYLNTEKSYRTSAIIQFDNGQKYSSGLDSILVGGSDYISLAEKGRLYKSRENLIDLIERLKLNVSINNKVQNIKEKKYFDLIEINNQKSRTETILEGTSKTNFEIDLKEKSFSLRALNDNSISLNDGKYNQIYTLNNFVFYIERKNGTYQNEIIQVSEGMESSIALLDRKINTIVLEQSSWNVQASLMEISFVDTDPILSEEILKNLNEIFIEKSIKNNSKQARASINFLDEQLEIIEIALSTSETKLTDFQEENLFFQQGEEGKSLLSKLREFETQLNEINLEEVRIQEQYNPSSLAFKSFMSQKGIIQDQVESIKDLISNLPNLEQSYINLLREVELNQQTLKEILNKKIEFSISEASTLSDIAVIVQPFTDIKVVSPILFRYVFFALVITVIFSFILLMINIYLFAKFRFPDELYEISDTKFLGVIPNMDLEGALDESINSITTNITSLLGDGKKTIMVTGSLKGIGKTTTSINISKGLANSGFKVLLIDCDLRRGDINKNFNLRKSTVSDYINYDENKFKIDENLHVLTRVSEYSNSPLTFFNSEIFSKSLEQLKERFDYIVIDTPPVLAVSDALLLVKYADININVVRHNMTKHRDYIQSLEMFDSISDILTASIYNDFKKQFGYYGYDYYSYKYYSEDYGYQSKD